MVYKDKEKQKEYRRQYYLNNKDKWKKKCEHQKQKSRCVECKGSEICEHQKQKSKCVECKGSEICEHQKQKYTCIECGGKGICEHQKHKSRCEKCNIFGYLVHLQRSRLNKILRNNNNISKTKSTIEYLDCSVDFFLEWIKNKFVDGMTFDNIHLDH